MTLHQTILDLPCLVREALRSATASAHARIDAQAQHLLSGNEAGYIEFLLVSARAIRPLEEALTESGIHELLPDWPERRRSEALALDLADFGVALDREAALSLDRSDAYRFGVLYVLEGSRLGAKLLAKRLVRHGSPRVRVATRYLRHGDGLPLWQSFLHRLETSLAIRTAIDRAIQGATDAFARFQFARASDEPPSHAER